MDALGRVPAAVLCVAAIALAVMYCGNDNVDPAPKTNYHRLIAAGDGHMHFLITRSIVFDRDLDFDNDLARFGDPWNQPRTITGKKNVMQQIGPSLIWAPILALAHGAALVGNAFGAGIEINGGYSLFHQRILFASSVVFAWLAIGFGIACARRLGAGAWAATWAGVAVLFGTTLTYYATYMPSYAHAMDAAACAIFLARWTLTLGELRWRRYVELGVWLGVATMVRVQDLGFGVVLALELVLLAWRSRDPRVLARGALSLAIALVMFVPQLYVWNEFYGSWLTTPQGPGQMRYGHPMVMELLFSSRNGWLSSHPIAYLGVIGLAVGAIAGKRLGPHVRLVCGALLAAVAIQVYVNSVTYEWWSGASFGQRRMASSTLPNLVGVALLLHACSRLARRWAPKLPQLARQAIAVVLLGYLVTWNIVVVRKLKHGANVDRVRATACCDDLWEPLAVIARPVHRIWGNPFELPASAIFALRYGVTLIRWDQANGEYPLEPGVLGYEDGSYRHATAKWGWGGPWIISGLGPTQHDGATAYRWTTDAHAEALLPILMPEPHRVTLPIAANAAPGETVDVTISCNGDVVAHASVGPAWTDVTFDTDGSIGDNDIEIASTPRPWRGGVPAPAEGGDVGVAIGVAHLALPPRAP